MREYKEIIKTNQSKRLRSPLKACVITLTLLKQTNYKSQELYLVIFTKLKDYEEIEDNFRNVNRVSIFAIMPVITFGN